MKIAILTPGGVDRSGTERVIPCLLWLIERLARAGDDVHVIAVRQETREGHWPLLGALVHNAGGVHPISRGLRTLKLLFEEHKRGRIDIIHALWAVPQGMLAAIAGMTLGIPVLLHLPGGDLVRLPEIAYGGRLAFKGRLGLRLALAGANRIAIPSTAMVCDARRLGISAERVPFGVALDRWPPIPPRRRAVGAPANLLHVADLSLVKDQETLLMAASQLRARKVAFVLDLIGHDGLRGAVQRRAHELGLEEYVRFTGFLPQRELRERMCSADLLVVTSRHEAGPVVALEAAASGVPTIGTNVGFLAEWTPGAARVVAIGDSIALANGIADLLSDEAQRLLLASRAQEKAVAENADVTALRIRNLYSELMAERRDRPPPVGAKMQ
jgi:glycosyltransferase involved in cell wall biosynthesis